ncbi:MAG: IgGFc-binding protein [Deltaproteobacteria bacterium]|nr:IgGFc-binding protein [Deltaproteobacteria bacterium]
MRLCRYASVAAIAGWLFAFGCGPSAPKTDEDNIAKDGGTGQPDTKPTPCADGTIRCSGLTQQRCVGNKWQDVVTCDQGKICDRELGCVQCDPRVSTTCKDNAVYTCNAQGTIGEKVRDCGGEGCSRGQCQDPCGIAAANRSYLGCEYWAVDLDNAVQIIGPPDNRGTCDQYKAQDPSVATAIVETISYCEDMFNFLNPYAGLCQYGNDCSGASEAGTATCRTARMCHLSAQKSPFAIVVSNPDDSQPVEVTLSNASGKTYSTTVAPGAVTPIFPQRIPSPFPDQSLDHSGIEAKAYKLTSNRPIVAYQFNPLDNVGVFSNDASLLIPASTYDTSYYAVTLPGLPVFNPYITVVASTPGTTTVTVTPKAPIRGGNGVRPLTAGSPATFTLSQFQVLNLEGNTEGDLTGTRITADKPVGVFVGHEAMVLSPNMDKAFADHLEDQLFPASTWGKLYAVARSQKRKNEPDLIRVVAQKDGTQVTFNPAGSCPTLGSGQFCDVWIDGDVEISATEPILVAHFLTSISDGAKNEDGDPAIAFAVPTEQFRQEYTFLVPSQYKSNYISLVVPDNGTAVLDSSDVTPQLVGFAGKYKGGRIAVQPGQHKLRCPAGCGIEVHGYDGAVSYLFAGGLDLKRIVID